MLKHARYILNLLSDAQALYSHGLTNLALSDSSTWMCVYYHCGAVEKILVSSSHVVIGRQLIHKAGMLSLLLGLTV